jgi:DNA polymerase-3 subunit epsilon
MPLARTLLPPDYYVEHFHEMLNHVSTVCAGLLGETERAFIREFRALNPCAQRLYVRMINRKKLAFLPHDLVYAEIDDLPGGLENLKRAGFLRGLDPRDHRVALSDLSKPELIALAKAHGLSVKSSWSKPQVVEPLLEAVPFTDFAAAYEEAVVPDRRETLDFLLYLQFGHFTESMSRFALRDLGVAPAQARASHSPRFISEAAARAGFFYHRRLEEARQGRAAPDDNWPDPVTEDNRRLRDKLLHRLGQAAEKAGDAPRALALYARADAFDCRERRVRLLYAAGELAQVEALLDAMLQGPEHDEEYIFAADFTARKFGRKRTGVFTDLLRDAETIEVDELYRGDAEFAAMQYFAGDGWTAHHVENALWPTLFGLIFWEELFETEGAMASDFDWLPQTLRDNSFAKRFASQLASKLDIVRRGEAAMLIQAALNNHMNKPNGLFVWRDDLAMMLTPILAAAPSDGLAGVLEAMAQDWRGHRDGFPDLVLTREDELRFIEIKGEGDQIRRHQLARLNLLRRLGFRADILRVAYRIDPDQTYVVVDVETTGGRPPNDRVTEIGAVKIRRGDVIAEWSSLINPQKHIPAFITQLTGISNDMTAEAPVFADIADDFAAFLDGAVFVAHNVGFDHGFIASEFRRLGRRFRHPKLCTVAGMRRWYPGHASYSLANLCKQYAIPLIQHHRALADARAAAHLLNLINERRYAAADKAPTA